MQGSRRFPLSRFAPYALHPQHAERLFGCNERAGWLTPTPCACRVVLACLCVNQIEAVEKWARDNDLQIPWEPAGIAPRNASNDSDGRLPCCGNTLAYSQLGQRTV
jgi:hypothetical protein